MGLSKAEAFFKNEEELEIIYPAEVNSTKDKKKMKEIILRENPEILLSDYNGPENNRVRCNLLFFTEHPSTWHSTLCSTMTCKRKGGISKVGHLEEDNKELKQELRRVREELAKREQHSHTLERLLEETRNQLHTIQQQQCVSSQTHSSPTTTTQHQRCVSTQTHNISTTEFPSNSTQQQRINTQSQSPFTPATCQSPQANQNFKRKGSSTPIHPPATTSSTSIGREQKSKDNIVILCDSNGHHLDPRRLFPGRSVKKFWCPTSHSALRLLQDASKVYPTAKVIISALLPRRDVPQKIINTINVEIAGICASMTNVHVANHQRITHEHLYDHIHIHREGIRLFAKTIKEQS
ncbi:hypothetical protein QQF64_031494 [Cirrhinus molitorella]|uniref:Uncharacterized protein n=1 Tax=Cirrhinus molitorella TaxID=172907 RepID=A0ABR3MX69_9TELE